MNKINDPLSEEGNLEKNITVQNSDLLFFCSQGLFAFINEQNRNEITTAKKRERESVHKGLNETLGE